MIPRETDLNKQEISATDGAKELKLPSSSTTASWSRLKDPRIVRVSKAFGGKDRHSKVCTVRGLRDRRVRLSVPTAIQLYDLQDRLGLNQPSKVVDWLLNAAKHEIDELPPLEIPPGSFQAMVDRQALKASTSNTAINWTTNDASKQAKLGILGGKLSREASGETSTDREETNWGRNDQEEGRFDLENSYVSENSFPSRQHVNPNPSSTGLSGLLNSSISYNTFVRWDPSNLTLSHPPRSDGLTLTPEDCNWQHNFGLLPMSAPSGSHSHHQVLVYQPGLSTQPYFATNNNSEFDPKELTFQNSPRPLESAVSRPIHFSTTANLLPSQNNEGDERNKGSI